MLLQNQNDFSIGLMGTYDKDKDSLLNSFELFNNNYEYLYKKIKYTFINLPQSNSILDNEKNSIINRDFLCFNKPSGVIIISNLNNLESNLNLLFEVMELMDNIVLLVDCNDITNKYFNEYLLQKSLGIPVILNYNSSDFYLDIVLDSLFDSINLNFTNKTLYECNIENVANSFINDISNIIPYINSRWLSLRIICNDESFFASLSNNIDELSFSKVEDIKLKHPKVLNYNRLRNNLANKNKERSAILIDKVYSEYSDNKTNTYSFVSNILAFKIYNVNISILFTLCVAILAIIYLFIKS